MKVLYLINFAGDGGSERYVEKLMRAFHPTRCDCALGYNEAGPLVDKAKAMGVPTFQITMKSPFDLSAAKALAKLCKDQGIDVIHAQYPRENYVAILARRLFGCKARVVFTAHLIIQQPSVWRVFNRIFTPADHKLIAVCEASADAMRTNGMAADKIALVYNGIAADAMPPRDRSALKEFGIGPQETVFITLARFSEEKGLPFLCESIARLKEKTDLPFRVIIAGAGDLFEEIRGLVQKLNLQDTVVLPGFRRDTDRLLAAADICLNSSSSEAMSFALLEGMACGLPLIATNVGGNRTLVHLEGEAGLTPAYGDVEGYSDAMLQLLQDPELRRKLGETALQKARGIFSEERSYQDTLAAYAP